jgi:HAD superfamily hydrolase (TIGR01549 family)
MSHVKRRALSACVFDLGNTLVNDTRITKAAVAEMGNWLYSKAWIESPEIFVNTYLRFNYSSNRPFYSHTLGELEFFEQTFRALSVEAISPRKALEKYKEIVIGKFHADPDMVEAFNLLRENGIRLALLSNEPTARVDAYIEQTDLSHFFDTIIVSEAICLEKPDPLIFQEVLNRLDTTGENTAMFGDNDIADGACTQLGIFFVLVTAYRNKDWIWEDGSGFKPGYVMKKISRKEIQMFLDSIKA